MRVTQHLCKTQTKLILANQVFPKTYSLFKLSKLSQWFDTLLMNVLLESPVSRQKMFKRYNPMSRLMTKTTKWHMRPVWSAFAVRMKKAWILSYPLSTQRRLWSESSLGAHAILLVLSWGGSVLHSLHTECRVAKKIFANQMSATARQYT